MNTKQVEQFNKYCCVNDSIQFELEGFKFRATIEHDDCYSIGDDDCHTISDDMTPEQVEQVKQAIQAYNDDEWYYGCLKVEGWLDIQSDTQILIGTEWLGGIEVNYPNSDNNYLNEESKELATELILAFKPKLSEIVNYLKSMLK